MFEKFGDYYIYKDTKNSIYLEFYFIDKNVVPARSLDKFCEIVKGMPELKIIQAVHHNKAPKFKAHNRIETE